MKTALILICLLLTPAAFAQYGVYSSINSQPVVYQAPSHPEHAAYAPMMSEQSVIASTGYPSVQGERRASDFAQAQEIALGTYAREFRKQREQIRKSRVVWINQ